MAEAKTVGELVDQERRALLGMEQWVEFTAEYDRLAAVLESCDPRDATDTAVLRGMMEGEDSSILHLLRRHERSTAELSRAIGRCRQALAAAWVRAQAATREGPGDAVGGGEEAEE